MCGAIGGLVHVCEAIGGLVHVCGAIGSLVHVCGAIGGLVHMWDFVCTSCDSLPLGWCHQVPGVELPLGGAQALSQPQ